MAQSSPELSLATSLLQVIVIVIPLWLTFVRFIFERELWDAYGEGSFHRIMIPGGLIVGYILIFFVLNSLIKYFNSAVIQSHYLHFALFSLNIFAFFIGMIGFAAIIERLDATTEFIPAKICDILLYFFGIGSLLLIFAHTGY